MVLFIISEMLALPSESLLRMVDYVMLDGASTNRAFMNMLLGGNARAAKYIIKDIYSIEHQIFVIQVSKHVIKRIRNSIEASELANKSSPGRNLTI